MFIYNPYNELEEHHCFACSAQNPCGLHMRFEVEGEQVICNWKPEQKFQGFYNVLHGGIQATLMDEIAAWAVQLFCKTAGVTSNMNVKYLHPVHISNEKIKLVATIESVRRRIADVKVDLFDEKETLCATATVTYFLFNETIAREQFMYPGAEAFIEEKE